MLPWGTNPAPFEFPIRTQRFSPLEQKGTFIPHLKGSWDPHVGKQKTCYSVWPAVWVGKNRTPFLDCHSSLMTLQPQGESCCWNPSVVLLATCAEYAFHFSGGTILWLKPTVGWESSMFFGSSHHDCVVTFVFLCVKIKKIRKLSCFWVAIMVRAHWNSMLWCFKFQLAFTHRVCVFT